MEVTQEMIEAVRLHEAAEDRRREKEYRDAHIKKQQERDERLKAGALAQVRTVVAGLTEESFGKLEDIFSEYLHDKEDW